MDWDKAAAELRKKLNPANVKPAAKFGPKGDYIEGWLAIDEANRIFGFGEWSYEVSAVTCVAEKPRGIGKDKVPGFGVTYTAHVRVVVGGVVREDFGAGHGYDVDLGLAHESAIKEAVTDSLKRALRTFGNPFGLALYDKTRENVGVDEPAFDASAELARILRLVPECRDAQGLTDLWGQNRADIDRIKEAQPASYKLLVEAFAARKAKLVVPLPQQMQEAVDEADDLAGVM